MFARTYLHLLTLSAPLLVVNGASFAFQKQPFYSSKGHLSLIKRAPFADQKDSFHFLPPFGRGRGGFFSKNTSPPPLFVWNADKHRGSGRGGVLSNAAKIWNSRQFNNTFLYILSFPAKPDRFLSFSVVFPLFSFFFFINDEKNFVNVCVE